jgi:membrane protease YdiL (CAAX protease family)
MAALPLQQPVGGAAALGPATRSDAWRWIVTAGCAYVVGQVLALVLASVGAAVTDAHGGVAGVGRLASPPLWYLLAGYAGLWAGFGAAAWLVTRNGRRLGLRFRPSDVRFVLLGIVLQLALAAAYLPVNHQSLSRPEHVLLGSGGGWSLVAPAVLVVVGAPLFEELFFRGVLLRGLVALWAGWRRVLGTLCAVAVDGTLFGLAHLGTDQWIQLPGLASIGVVLAALALGTRRLGPSIVTHASFNALAVYIYVAAR